MSEHLHDSVHDLFNRWRNGSSEAGQEMAQRVADWYFALAVTHLGEEQGQVACEAACSTFSTGAANFASSEELVHWCQDTIHHAMGRKRPGVASMTMSSSFTLDCPPKELIAIAWQELPEELLILTHCYSSKTKVSALVELCEKGDGYPLELLKARDRLKTWLHTQHDVPFFVSETPTLSDWAPLPIYESGRMTEPKEARQFEAWLLDNPPLCRDITEFAHFAIALRDSQCIKLSKMGGSSASFNEKKENQLQRIFLLLGILLGLAAIIANLLEWI